MSFESLLWKVSGQDWIFTQQTQKEACQSFRQPITLANPRAAAPVFVYINYTAFKPFRQVQANTKNCKQWTEVLSETWSLLKSQVGAYSHSAAESSLLGMRLGMCCTFANTSVCVPVKPGDHMCTGLCERYFLFLTWEMCPIEIRV